MRRCSYILVFALFSIIVKGQTINQIDSLVNWIDSSVYTDTVVCYGSDKSEYDSIIGYISNDTIKMASVFLNKSNRLNIYYWKPYKLVNDLLFVSEIKGAKTAHYYFWNDSLLISDYERYSEYDNAYTNDIFEKFEGYLSNVEFQYIEDQAQKYIFVGRLVDVPKMTPHCGAFAFSRTFKFEVIESDYSNYDSKYVLINQPCPELYDDGFFVKNGKYRIYAATNDGAPFNYIVHNDYDEDTPIFWSRDIEVAE